MGGAVRLEQWNLLLVLVPHALVQAFQTQVASATLGQRKIELEARMLLKIREVAHDHLFLQRDRCAADDHGLAQCLGNRNGGQAIRRRLTGTGTRLDRGEPG